LVSTTLVKSHFVQYLDCSVELHFFVEIYSVPFRGSELALLRNSECLRVSTFLRKITETVPSIFHGIFSEQNFVSNPYTVCPLHLLSQYSTNHASPAPTPVKLGKAAINAGTLAYGLCVLPEGPWLHVLHLREIARRR
jgi:hypothetical protein